jgi:hypothetical protein
VVVEEGPRVEIVSVEVAAAPLLRLTVLGEKLQEMPGGRPVGHASITGLEELLAGVTVIVAVAELPAVMDEVGRLAVRLKSGMFTVTFSRALLWK